MKNIQSSAIENKTQFLIETVSDSEIVKFFVSPIIKEPNALTILQRIAKTDKFAINECIETYGDLIWTLAKEFKNLSSGKVEKAVQKVFLDIWKYAKRFDPLKFTEKDFIMFIARQRLIRCENDIDF